MTTSASLIGPLIKSSSALVGTFKQFSFKSPRPYKKRCLFTAAAAPDTIVVHFQSANITVNGKPGDNIFDLAERNGVETITAGCCSGNCGICEVEVRKYEDDDADASDDAAVAVVREREKPPRW